MIVSWVCGSIALVLFPILTKVYFNNNPAHIIAFTAALTLLALVIFYFMAIETQGKTEKDIKEEFHNLNFCINSKKISSKTWFEYSLAILIYLIFNQG